METQPYTISHSGSVVGTDNTVRAQNQIDPQRETSILSFTCPKNFESITLVGRRDPIRFIPRTMETFSGDGSTTTFTLEADTQPIAGEPELEDQPYPAVVAAVVGSGEIDVTAVDYTTNEVTLASAPASGTDNVKLYPVILEGTLKLRGINTLGQNEGPINKWPFPLRRFSDVLQDKRGSAINLQGSVSWNRNETVEYMIDSPRKIVWEDADYPGAYVSTLEQEVEITF